MTIPRAPSVSSSMIFSFLFGRNQRFNKERNNIAIIPRGRSFSYGCRRYLLKAILLVAVSRIAQLCSIQLHRSAIRSVHYQTGSSSSSRLVTKNGHTPPHRPTFLWGIATADNDDGRYRRAILRETYLSFYKTDAKHPHRICSLNDVLLKTVTLEEDHCQVAYAFFIGGNPSGPSELLFPNTSYPIRTTAIPKTSTIRNDEHDVVYLNIRENQEDGKMPTWFKYASMVVEEQKYPFDYIAKVDSDTLVFIPAFLEFAQVHMMMTMMTAGLNSRDDPKEKKKLVHVGLPMFNYFCNPKSRHHDHSCPLPLTGGLYMSGEVSIMSSELARVMTSKDCIRSPFIRHEDILLSNWAFHCAANITNSTVHVIPVRQEQILKGKDTVASWQRTTQQPKLPHRFYYTLWAHSTTHYGGYYKDFRNVRESWMDFVNYWNGSNSTITTRTVVSSTLSDNMGTATSISRERDFDRRSPKKKFPPLTGRFHVHRSKTSMSFQTQLFRKTR